MGSEGRHFDAGRIRFDGREGRLELRGVLSDVERDAILRDTAPPGASRGIEDEIEAKKALLAAADPSFRKALDELHAASQAHRVSPWYLIIFYLLATFAELCLSPVGLSMVSKLAPARFATLLMGLWFVTTFSGTFAAGAMGELWGTLAPAPYFFTFVVVCAAAAGLALLSKRVIARLMHGVR
jgi:POT family proton-dependent oligopeptide transporter